MNHRSLLGATHRSLLGATIVSFSLGALGACDTTSNETVACAQSLAEYCDSAPCPSHIDRNNDVESFCAFCAASQLLPVSFGFWGCDDGGSIIVQSSLGTFQYGADGSLEAVTQMQLGADPLFSCIAGPATFRPPMTCLSSLTEYECVRVDAGTD